MADPLLGGFQLAVLLSVARLHPDAYGAAICEDLTARLTRACTIGAVHATLQRLEAKRLLTSAFGEATPVRGGRAKRCYDLTAEGRAAVGRAKRASTLLWTRVPVWKA